jgi:hypothetical protein
MQQHQAYLFPWPWLFPIQEIVNKIVQATSSKERYRLIKIIQQGYVWYIEVNQQENYKKYAKIAATLVT